jgi:hypothetical protein
MLLAHSSKGNRSDGIATAAQKERYEAFNRQPAAAG